MAQDSTQTASLTVDQAAERFDALLRSEEEQGAAPQPEQDAEPQEEEQEQPEASQSDKPDAEPEPDPEQDGEAEPEPEEGEGEPQPEQSEIDPESIILKVKIGDEEQEITAEEARKGYMRQADYTRKTQELATAKKEFAEKELPLVREERAQYAQLISQLRQTLEMVTPKEPDWAKLKEESPEAFADTWAAWQLHQKRLHAVSEEQKAALAKVQEDQQAQYEAYVEAESQKLAEVIPEIADPEKGKVVKTNLVEYARKIGFSDEEIAAVADHRALVLLHKARLYDESQKRKPEIQKKVAVARAVARPGAKPGAATSVRTREVTEVTRAKIRAAKTGSVKDAAAAIDLMLQAGDRKRR